MQALILQRILHPALISLLQNTVAYTILYSVAVSKGCTLGILGVYT